jgi:OPA family sugar phosphate sensor protein UhpC-like MFS transporter
MVVKGFTSFMLGVSIAGFAVWQGAFWACSAVMLLIWVMFFLLQRNKPEDVGLPAIVTEDSELDQELGRAGASPTGGHRAGFFKILLTPTVLMMGVTYFCFKFVRYAIDSWLPYMFKNKYPELSYGESGYYSLVFDLMGIAGGILAGWALDRLFGGRWRSVCLAMVIGMLGAFLSVYVFGGISPIVLSILTGLVGFMLFGPDTILSGAASVDVGGKHEAVAAAGIVNGIGSMGPIVQEPLIGWLLDTFPDNRLTSVTILFITMTTVATLLLGLMWWRERRRLRLDSLGGGI